MDILTTFPTLSATWAAVPKWATRSSSDAIGIANGSRGALVIVMVDVQGSGPAGTQLAGSLLAFATNLIQSGVGVETATESTRQHLQSLRQGKVFASLLLASPDPADDELAVATVGRHLVALQSGSSWTMHETGSGPAAEHIRLPFATGAVALFPNDGVAVDVDALQRLLPTAATRDDLARSVLQAAINRDGGRPRSDMAVAAVMWPKPQAPHAIETASHTVTIDLLPVRP